MDETFKSQKPGFLLSCSSSSKAGISKLSLQGQIATVFNFADPAVSVTTPSFAFPSLKPAQCFDKTLFTKAGEGPDLLAPDLRPWSLDCQCPAAEGGERSRSGLE